MKNKKKFNNKKKAFSSKKNLRNNKKNKKSLNNNKKAKQKRKGKKFLLSFQKNVKQKSKQKIKGYFKHENLNNINNFLLSFEKSINITIQDETIFIIEELKEQNDNDNIAKIIQKDGEDDFFFKEKGENAVAITDKKTLIPNTIETIEQKKVFKIKIRSKKEISISDSLKHSKKEISKYYKLFFVSKFLVICFLIWTTACFFWFLSTALFFFPIQELIASGIMFFVGIVCFIASAVFIRIFRFKIKNKHSFNFIQDN